MCARARDANGAEQGSKNLLLSFQLRATQHCERLGG